MNSYWFLISLIASATAILWPPVCILCPNNLYPIVLTTCVMGSVIPMNVSYTQASCIVGNCAVNMNPKPPAKPKREAQEQDQENEEKETLASSLFGGDVPSIPTLFEEDQVRVVPYTMLVDGHNVTITSVEEYFVHSDEQQIDDSLDEELE